MSGQLFRMVSNFPSPSAGLYFHSPSPAECCSVKNLLPFARCTTLRNAVGDGITYNGSELEMHVLIKLRIHGPPKHVPILHVKATPSEICT